MGKYFDTSFARKQFLLGLGLAGVSVLVIATSLYYCRSHMIGSKSYFELESSMDLVADILPPPAYLIEYYLVSKELVESERSSEREYLVKRAGSLRAEYMIRHDHWMQNLPEGAIRDKFAVTSLYALELIRTMEEEFLPLIAQGRIDEARQILNQKLTPLFRSHRQAVEETVPLAIDKRETIAENAVQESSKYYMVAMLVSVLAIGLALGVYWRLGRSLRRRILLLQESAISIASGNLDSIFIDDNNDEIGHTSRTYHEVKRSLALLTEEISQLVEAARQGDLSVRVNPTKYQGVFADLVEGLNGTLVAINEPIDEAVVVLANVAERDLTRRVEGEYAGQFECVKASLNNALDGLSELLTQVAVGADSVECAASGIAESSQSLAQRASIQATTLAGVAKSMDQIAAATLQNAGNNETGRELSDELKRTVDHGVQVVQNMSEAISKIRESAKASALIVKTIDDIAFQTGILSMNAAVEAARAGHSGKGFTVVAGEFKNLAAQSADAARLTAKMIADSELNAETGVSITVEMGDVLARIRNSSNQVNELMAGIAMASQEQSCEIEYVNRAIADLHALTSQTANESVKSAHASRELSAQATILNDGLSKFQLGEAMIAEFSKAD